MTLVVAVEIVVMDTVLNQALIRVQNTETIHPDGTSSLMEAGLARAVIERLADDVKERASDQTNNVFVRR